MILYASTGVLVLRIVVIAALAVAVLMIVLRLATAVLKALGRRRQRYRPCPRCGRRVAVGVLDCEACGFDFRSIGV